jgi:hypothetical protein
MTHTRSIHPFVLVLLAMVGVWALTACGPAPDRGGDARAAEEGRHDHEAHGVDDGHDESHQGEGGAPSLQELGQARCEHDSPTYECADCRYEIGVVKVPESFLGTDGGPVEAMVRLEVAGAREVAPGLHVTGEVRLNENAAVHVSPRIPGTSGSSSRRGTSSLRSAASSWAGPSTTTPGAASSPGWRGGTSSGSRPSSSAGLPPSRS